MTGTLVYIVLHDPTLQYSFVFPPPSSPIHIPLPQSGSQGVAIDSHRLFFSLQDLFCILSARHTEPVLSLSLSETEKSNYSSTKHIRPFCANSTLLSSSTTLRNSWLGSSSISTRVQTTIATFSSLCEISTILSRPIPASRSRIPLRQFVVLP